MLRIIGRTVVDEPSARDMMVSLAVISTSGKMPNKVVNDAWGSVSITRTLWPSRLSPCARVMAVVVLVVPPLKLAIEMVMASAPSGLSMSLR